MSHKGTHTWDLVLEYHRCPKCGYILESRESYHQRLGVYVKELECDRCKNKFTIEKKTHPTFGPLIGDPQPIEMEWRDIDHHGRKKSIS